MGYSEYDLQKLRAAKKELMQVYEYNYGNPAMKKEVNRLETIIGKITYLENIWEEKMIN